MVFLFGISYGFFLSINRANTISPTMIRTNSAAIAGTKYMSATDVGVAVGAAVTVREVTVKCVWADEA